MSVDINGWVEARQYNRWRGIIRVADLLAAGNYDAFACLFGVANFARFRPVAPLRGLPADASHEVREELTGSWSPRSEVWEEVRTRFADVFRGMARHGPSWIDWGEIASLDMDELALAPDHRIHHYAVQPDGTLRLAGKALLAHAELAALLGIGVEQVERGGYELVEGQTWATPAYLYRVERLRRQDAFDVAWQTLFEMMRLLASCPGWDGVRLVVWFEGFPPALPGMLNG